jgi:hypothetical protein
VWEDLTWQQVAQIRFSLSGDKPFGPERFVVADLLLGDDIRKIKDLFNPVAQSSLLGEIVERKEEKSHGTAGQLEIHDMRSLYSAVDPSVQSIVQLIQTFVWWDLEDAADRARFDRRVAAIQRVDAGKLTQHDRDAYKAPMKTERAITDADIVAFELKMLKYCVESFRARRLADKGYQMIITREATAAQDPDMLIGALAQENMLAKTLRQGRDIDAGMKAQFAKAMGCEAAEATADRILPFLEARIAEHRKLLRDALNGNVSGAPNDFKKLQLAELEHRYEELSRGREPNQTHA